MISLSYIAALAQGYYCCRYILLISIMQVSVFTAVLVSTSYLVPRTAVWCVTGTAVLWIKSLSTTKRVPVHSALQLCTYTAVQQSSVASSSRRGVIASWMRGEAQQKSSLPVACITIYWYLPVVVSTKLWQLLVPAVASTISGFIRHNLAALAINCRVSSVQRTVF